MPRPFLLLVLGLLISCSSAPQSGDDVTVSGALAAATQDTVVPASATIGVLGRSPDEFTATFETDPTKIGNFKLKDLPFNELLQFQISGGNLESLTSFPLRVDPNTSLALPVALAGKVAEWKQAATAAGVTMASGAVIMGILGPFTGCSGATGVDLISRDSGTTVLSTSTNGPLYLQGSKLVLSPPAFQDPSCTFFMFNIPSGNYRLKMISSTGETAPLTVPAAATAIVGYGMSMFSSGAL